MRPVGFTRQRSSVHRRPSSTRRRRSSIHRSHTQCRSHEKLQYRLRVQVRYLATARRRQCLRDQICSSWLLRRLRKFAAIRHCAKRTIPGAPFQISLKQNDRECCCGNRSQQCTTDGLVHFIAWARRHRSKCVAMGIKILGEARFDFIEGTTRERSRALLEDRLLKAISSQLQTRHPLIWNADYFREFA